LAGRAVAGAPAATLPLAEVDSVIEAYGVFSLVRLRDGAVAAVTGPGHLLKTYPDYGIVSLNGQRVDAASAPAVWAGPGGYIVQTIGPVKGEWRDWVARQGAILDYVPHFSFLLWLPHDTLPALRSAPFVRAITSYSDAFKVGPDVQATFGLGREISVLVQLYDPSFSIDPVAYASLAGAEYDAEYAKETKLLPPYRLLKLDGVFPENLAGIVKMRQTFFIDKWDPPTLDDEVSTQIIAANIVNNKPVLGYAAWIASLNLDGSGFVMGHSDSGVDIDHVDFESRVKGPSATGSGGSHGTHTMSTILGTPIGAGKDSNGFLYGQGVAPKAEGYAVPLGASDARSQEMSQNGAIGSSNSWNSGSAGADYGTEERQQDIYVLDADSTTPGAQRFAQIFSAGNAGSSGLTEPHAAKNIVAVCASENGRTGNINNKASFSSVGNAVDGRVKPEVCAPGADVYSAQSGSTNGYVSMSGTSMSCPHVAGATLLVFQWHKREYGTAPSPAMNKAMLVNGAMNMVGGNAPDIPNNYEGWGRVNLNDTFAKSRGVMMTHLDDKELSTGQEFTLSASAADPSLPLKITVAWDDEPGASGANPALVNDLDLVVESSAGTYNGNNFQSSWSVTGGAADAIDNLENVWIQNPSGAYTIKVKGTNVAQGPQKFALVVFNSGAPSANVKVDTPKGGEAWKGGDQVNVAWTSSGPLQANSVALSFSSDGGATWDPPFSQNQPLNGSAQWTVAAVDTTKGVLRAVAKDSGGADVQGVSGTFTVDSTPPVATASALPAVTTVANFDIAFTANDTGSGVKDVEVFYRIGGGAYASAGKSASSPLQFTATVDGKHEFYASGTDNVGNVEAAASSPEAFTLVDLVPPTLLSSVPANNAVDVSPDVTVELKFSEGMDRASVESSIAITPQASKGSYAWGPAGDKVSFPLTGLALLTKYDVKVGGKDLAGRDMAPATASFTTSKIPTNPAKLSGKVTDVFTIQGIEGATITVSFGTITWTATTDATGAYTVDKLPGEKLSVMVKKTGYADANAQVQLSPGGAGTKDFVLTPPGAPYSLIRGKVVDQSDAPIEGAEVKVKGVDPVITLADGAFELRVAPGTHSVEAAKKDMTGDPVEATVGEWEIKEVTLKLRPAPKFDPLSMSVAGIPLLWLIILIVAALAAVAVASRRRKGGKCQWCSSPLARGAAQCGACGAAVGGPPAAPGSPSPVTETPPATPPAEAHTPPPEIPASPPASPSGAAGDPAQWNPGPPPA
jgi:hypothetical protein